MSPPPSDQELAAMTVNERLARCGLFPRWDVAVKARKRDEMIALLGELAIPEPEAARTIDLILANPKRYGF